MIIFDTAIINGLQYSITSAIFGLTALFTYQKKIKPDFSNPNLNLGFIFSIIGLTSAIEPSMHIGMWALGIILFLRGLFFKAK